MLMQTSDLVENPRSTDFTKAACCRTDRTHTSFYPTALWLLTLQMPKEVPVLVRGFCLSVCRHPRSRTAWICDATFAQQEKDSTSETLPGYLLPTSTSASE